MTAMFGQTPGKRGAEAPSADEAEPDRFDLDFVSKSNVPLQPVSPDWHRRPLVGVCPGLELASPFFVVGTTHKVRRQPTMSKQLPQGKSIAAKPAFPHYGPVRLFLLLMANMWSSLCQIAARWRILNPSIS
jgi:hypothetical protein